MMLRAFLVWVVITLVEVGHGILRGRFLNRRVGSHRANQIGVATGSALILVIAWLTVPWIGPRTTHDCLAVGALWFVLMLAFDILFGRLVFRASWDRIASSFDLRRGGFLAFGMLVLLFAPLMLTRWAG